MAPELLLHRLIPLLLVLIALTRVSRADVPVLDAAKELSVHIAADELDWPSMYGGIDEIDVENDSSGAGGGRRSLFWKRMGYYISYGALSANRVPCPPRSGRSYYTHNCWRASGPAHPYSRGCSTITHCRR